LLKDAKIENLQRAYQHVREYNGEHGRARAKMAEENNKRIANLAKA